MAQVRPRSSVWINRAIGFTARIARMASRVASIWLRSACQKDRSSRACGYQWPYSAAKRAVVTGSLTGVQSLTHG